jgi:hypothetical protein
VVLRPVVKPIIPVGQDWVMQTIIIRGRRDRMVVGFSTTCAISAYRH